MKITRAGSFTFYGDPGNYEFVREKPSDLNP